MILKTESGYKTINPTKQQILDEISVLDGVDNSFIILENDTESYIQVGGGPEEFTVEVRVYINSNDFTHWKAEYQQSDGIVLRTLSISGASVKIPASQILNIETVQRLFMEFADGVLLSTKVTWVNITSMFINS